MNVTPVRTLRSVFSLDSLWSGPDALLKASAPWLSSIVAVAMLSMATMVDAHNNPEFREDLLQTIMVDPMASPNSEAFSIEWPEKTVQLIWRVVGVDESVSITLNLLQDGESVAEFASPEGATNRFEGEGFSLTASDADKAFSVELYAKVLDRSKDKN